MDFGAMHGGSLLYDEEISTRASATREQMDWQHMEGESWDEYRQPRREISEATYYVTASSHFTDAESSQTTAETSQNTELVIDHEQSDERDDEPLSNAAVLSHLLPLRRALSESEIMSRPIIVAPRTQVGQIFANRYWIEQSTFPEENPNIRFAIDMSTEERVFLKFFPNALRKFENTIRMHRILNESPHVCKLLASIKECGFPPCLVYERGSYTLAERLVANSPSMIRRQAILYSILEALENIHGHDVTYGRLEPGKIMWFPADSTWKLIDLKCASVVDEWTLVSDVTGEYAAPEVRSAHQEGQQRILMGAAADMWSLGVIALEILTEATFIDGESMPERVADFMRASHSDAALSGHRWLFADPGGRHSGSDEQRYHRFLCKLLCENPMDRATAADALGEVLFRNIEAARQRGHALRHSSHNALQTYPLLRALILSQLQVDTKAEIVFARNPSNLSFLSREGVPAYTDHDEDLGSTKIYVLRCGERFRLRLKISYAEGCQLPIRGIESIALETSTGSLVPLRHQIEIDDRMQFAATVEVDPTIDILKEHFAICPFYGTVEERYRKATLQLKFLVEDDPASPLVKNCEIYFLIVRSGRKLRCYRLARAIQQRWSRLPKPAKQTIRMIYHGVSKAVECVLP